MNKEEKLKRNREIYILARTGKYSVKELAEKYGLAPTSLGKILEKQREIFKKDAIVNKSTFN